MTAASFSCVYPVSGTFFAKGYIKDKDGGVTDHTVQVNVLRPHDAVQNLIAQVQALNNPAPAVALEKTPVRAPLLPTADCRRRNYFMVWLPQRSVTMGYLGATY
ncbi:MAG: hypothetical protein ACREOO_10900 [bacterium]